MTLETVLLLYQMQANINMKSLHKRLKEIIRLWVEVRNCFNFLQNISLQQMLYKLFIHYHKIYFLEYMITEEALKENKKLQDIITQINTENKTLKEQLQIHQTQQTNIEPKPRIDEANTQYLVGNIKELKKENKRIQDLYNGLSSNFSKLAAMVEQNNLKRDINPNLAKDTQENKQPILSK